MLRHILKEETVTSERELAKIIGVSHGAVNKALKDFHDLNLVSPLRIGNSLAWQLNKQSYAYRLLQNFIHEIKATPLDNLKMKVQTYLSARPRLREAIIYGSIAEGKDIPGSDIDLFILVEDEKERKDIVHALSSLNSECLNLYGNKISPSIFTVYEYRNPHAKNKTFLENVKKGIRVIER